MGSDFHPGINVSIIPAIGKKELVEIVKNHEPGIEILNFSLVIFPEEKENTFDYHLTWKVVTASNRDKLIFFVDAQTGELIYYYNAVKNLNGTVTGMVYPEHPLQQQIRVNFSYEFIYVNATRNDSRVFYSNSGNHLNNFIVTREQVNLTNISGANLTFITKYNIEQGWDFAYVEVFNGTCWEQLNGSYMSTYANPDAYAPGWVPGAPAYTGNSNIWLMETINLNKYINNSILLRFRYTTDDALVLEGIYFDNITITTDNGIVFFDDAEANNIWDFSGFTIESSTTIISAITDEGYYEFENLNGVMNLTSELRGLWVNVDNEDTTDAKHNFILNSNETHNWNWNESDTSDRNAESCVYYHVNKIHDYFKKFNYEGMDYQMKVTIEAGSDWCNAEYDPIYEDIALGGGNGGDCENIALGSDAIYHEYTHGAIDHIYNLLPYSGESGALDEALADYFAATINNNSLIAENILPSPRNLNNDLTMDDWKGKVHDDGRIISGAFWNLREELGAGFTDALIFEAIRITPHAYDFSEFLENLLVADDDNANLYDGTPDKNEICNKFYERKIYSFWCSDFRPDLTVKNLTYAPQNPDSISVVNITAIIENIGNSVNLNLSEVNVSLFIDNLYKDSKILNLTGISERKVNFTWSASAGEHNITIKVDPGNLINETNETNNELTVNISVVRLSCMEEHGLKNDTVIFYHASWCGACNSMVPVVEQLEEEGYVFHWAEVSDAGAKEAVFDCASSLLSGYIPQFMCVAENWQHTGTASKHYLRLIAQYCGQAPDLTVSGIYIPKYPKAGNNITINATIKNLMEIDTSDAGIEFLIDNVSLENKTINISRKTEKNVSFNWTAESGNHTITIKIVLTTTAYEFNKSDNERNKTIYVLPENVFVIDTLSCDSYEKELHLQENQTSVAYIKIPKNSNITLAGLNLTGLPYEIKTAINEIDSWKSSDAWIWPMAYCTGEDTYCFGYSSVDGIGWTKLIFNSSKIINLTKIYTHTTHSDRSDGGSARNYNLIICETNITDAGNANCGSDAVKLVNNTGHNPLGAPNQNHPGYNYDEQVMQNFYIIEPGKKYLVFWEPTDTTTEHAIARKIDSFYHAKSYPENTAIDIGNNSVINRNYSGPFNTTETISFKDELNEILKHCNCCGCVNEQAACQIPLVFHSDTDGIIKISDIVIFYAVPEKPDLKLENLTYFPQEVTAAGDIKIGAVVRNTGNFNLNLSSVNVSLLVDNNLIDSKILNLINISEIEVNFTWNAKEGTHDIKIKIDPNNEIDETNESNNFVETQVTAYVPELEVFKVSMHDVKKGSEPMTAIVIHNPGNVPVYNLTITDFMPEGFNYTKGTSRLNGIPIPDPFIKNSGVEIIQMNLTWNLSITAVLSEITPGTVMFLTYESMVESAFGYYFEYINETVNVVNADEYPVKFNNTVNVSGVGFSGEIIVESAYHEMRGYSDSELFKFASKSGASCYEYVDYTIIIRNSPSGANIAPLVMADALPPYLKYVPGYSYIGNISFEIEPTVCGDYRDETTGAIIEVQNGTEQGNCSTFNNYSVYGYPFMPWFNGYNETAGDGIGETLIWNLSRWLFLTPGQQVAIKYRVQILPGAGNISTNNAFLGYGDASERCFPGCCLPDCSEFMFEINATSTIHPTCSIKPDFTVTNLTLPGSSAKGENIAISALIKNLHNINLNLSSVNVSLLVDNNLTDSKILNLTNISEFHVNFTYENASADIHNIKVIADPGNLIDESNESNNFAEKTLTVPDCDLNLDGIVIHDYNDLMSAYRCFLGIEKNCKINYLDWKNMKREYGCFSGKF